MELLNGNKQAQRTHQPSHSTRQIYGLCLPKSTQQTWSNHDRLEDTEFWKDSKVRSTRIRQKLTEKKRTSEPLIRREEARGKEEPISRRPTSKKQLPFRPPAASKAAAMVRGGMRKERGGVGDFAGF